MAVVGDGECNTVVAELAADAVPVDEGKAVGSADDVGFGGSVGLRQTGKGVNRIGGQVLDGPMVFRNGRAGGGGGDDVAQRCAAVDGVQGDGERGASAAVFGDEPAQLD